MMVLMDVTGKGAACRGANIMRGAMNQVSQVIVKPSHAWRRRSLWALIKWHDAFAELQPRHSLCAPAPFFLPSLCSSPRPPSALHSVSHSQVMALTSEPQSAACIGHIGQNIKTQSLCALTVRAPLSPSPPHPILRSWRQCCLSSSQQAASVNLVGTPSRHSHCVPVPSPHRPTFPCHFCHSVPLLQVAVPVLTEPQSAASSGQFIKAKLICARPFHPPLLLCMSHAQVVVPVLSEPQSAASIGQIIIKAAEEADARMLVMANHGPGALADFGSVVR